MKNSIRVGDKVMGNMGVSGGYAGTVIAIKRDGRQNVVFYKDDDGVVYETLDSNITKNVPEKGKFPRKNPARRSDESPLYVKYLSLKSDEEPFMMQGTKYQYVWAEYPGGIKDIGVYSYANDLVYSYDSFRQMMNLDRAATNPKGVYTTYSAWRAAAKKNGAVRFEGGRNDIAQAWDAAGSWVGEWDGAEGFISKPKSKENPVRPRKGESSRAFVSRCMSEEKASFPEPKQRIAVCLSKSRKRNPLESGATISDDEDVNRQAAKMG